MSNFSGLLNRILRQRRTSFLALCVLLACALCTPNNALRAAPVTLGFEANIHTVFPGIPFESGIDFDVGDVISGKFTFNPSDGNGNMLFRTTQPYSSHLFINDVSIATPNFEIESVNNSPIADFEPADVIDSLRVGAGDLTPSDPTIRIDPELSNFRIVLYGPKTVVEMASHPMDVAVWNSFDLWREILVGFEDGNGGAIGFQATVGAFFVIPEPSTFCIAFLLFAVAINRQTITRRYYV